MLLIAAVIVGLAPAVAVQAVTLNVIGVDNTTNPPTETTLAADGYQWLVEEDLTYHVPMDGAGNPMPDANTLAVKFHRSYMPVAAKGVGSASFETFVPAADAHYYLSVLPNSGYSIGGAQLAPGQTEVNVYVNMNPMPSAQIVIEVCQDSWPINNVCDPTEPGLEGFEILVEDAGGRYGMSAGAQAYDIYGNLLGTTYLDAFDADGVPIVDVPGSGIRTDANGMVTIKHLAPGKYGIIVVPPAGEGWVQTATIEGTKVIDAWVKANEPAYFAEFGPPGPHVFVSFAKEFDNLDTLGGAPAADISGQVVNLHMSRPPDFAMFAGAPMPHTNCWVGLNEGLAGEGRGLFVTQCADEGNFSIPSVPAGQYQLVVWDDNMDQVFSFKSLTVNTDGSCNTGNTCDLGDVPVFQWFARMESWVFNDTNENGMRDMGEVGIPEQGVNMRWRDGSMYQSFPTDLDGFAPFDQIFPFFSWLVAEVDFARMKATGATIYVDDGGAVPFESPYSFGGSVAPQAQGTPADPDSVITTENYRVEEGVILTEGFQGFLGQTSVMEWGKKAYAAGENGGISGVVYYSVTRAEDDPRAGGPEPWEPGIPGVTINLWDSTGTQLLNTTTTDSWDDSLPTNCQIGSSVPFVFDPDGAGPMPPVTPDCYDGMRTFNQVRPAVFDGGYAFDEICSVAMAGDVCSGTWISPIPSGRRYVVEVEAPNGYEVVRSQDKNVDFGDNYVPSGLLLPAECVGTPYTVPQYLSLNDLPGVPLDERVEATLAGQVLNHCDRKKVGLSDRANAAADFFLFTEVPIAAHAVGFILDDTQNEFDPNSPQFGEKYAPPFLPISIRDWTGREIGRTLSDGFGRYNFLGPSSWTNSLPQPSGMSPNMLTTCMNAKLMPDGTPDPQHNSLYSQFCYTFQYMPGTTTYLDTPVVPVAAFTGADQFPLDCEFINHTPRIYSVTNAAEQGPYAAEGQVLTIASMGMQSVPNPEYEGIGGTTGKNIMRDYGFGCAEAIPTVTIGGVPLLGAQCGTDIDGREIVTGTVGIGTATGQLMVTRNDGLNTGTTTITGVTVQTKLRGQANVLTVPGDSATIQGAIDIAGDNDLILVAPGRYQEMVIMWKPVQLQGWGEGSTFIDAVKRAPESLQAWRDKAAFLVGNSLVNLLPGQEAQFGGIEPAGLFAEEGAGIFVLAKDGDFGKGPNKGARIDGFSISGADTGGGIILNGFASDMDISNNRVINNSGFWGGGIRLGHPTLIAEARDNTLFYPDAENHNVQIHHNTITQNGGINGAGGGVSLCTGSDNYELTENFICGNFNLQVGGGIGHFGLSDKGLIAENQILFNESFNQGRTVSGGGIYIAGQPPMGCPVDPITGLPIDPNCPDDPEMVLTPGTGGVDVWANLIQGNSAGAGDGGGIRLDRINGQDVAARPNTQGKWYEVRIFNNMIVDNIAALAGGGISLQDAKRVNIKHNTIANNDSSATAGDAFATGIPDRSIAQPGAGIVSHAHSVDLANFQKGSDDPFSNPNLSDNIIWQNRQFMFFGAGSTVDPNTGTTWFGLCPTVGGLAADCQDAPIPFNTDTAVYDDLAVLPAGTGTMTCNSCIVTGDLDPAFIAEYVNSNRSPWLAQPEQQTIATPAAFDEGGNFIRLRFGPLTLVDPTTGNLFADYHIQTGSSALDVGLSAAPATDYDGEPRPDLVTGLVDIGADEVQPPAPLAKSSAGLTAEIR